MGFYSQNDCTNTGARESNQACIIVYYLVLDIDVLTSVLTALEPLADFTDVLSGDLYVTVSSIKPTLKFIENASEAAHDDTNLTPDLKARVQADFQKCYTSETADYP